PLADDITLAFPTHAGDVSSVHRIAATFIVHVGDERIHVTRFRIHLVSNGDIEGLVGREVPTGGHDAFGGIREAGAVSAHLGPIHDIITGGNDLSLAFAQECRVERARGDTAIAGGEGIAADAVTIAFSQMPPTPATGAGIGW